MGEQLLSVDVAGMMRRRITVVAGLPRTGSGPSRAAGRAEPLVDGSRDPIGAGWSVEPRWVLTRARLTRIFTKPVC